MREVYIHPSALVETDRIGAGTRIWAFAHVMPGATIGSDGNICDRVFIETGARIGNGVTIKNNALIWSGVEIGDHVFVGPGAVFTNDRQPRSPRMPEVQARYADESGWLLRTVVEQGASIGACAVILPGLRLGAFCMIGAGSVVTRDVPPYRLVTGNPARTRGWVGPRGDLLRPSGALWRSERNGKQYRISKSGPEEVEP